MSKNFIKISFIILFQLLLIGCKNTSQKIQEFVTTYNNSAAYFSSGAITSTSAKAFLKEKKVEIRFETALEQDELNNGIYDQMFPDLIAEILKKDPSAMELINEGVNFEVFFLANDNTVLTELIVDKKKLDELLKKDLKSGSEQTAISSNPNFSTDLKEMLVLMNKNMPIKNSDGTKMLKIEISKKNELVYKIEVPEEFAALMKIEGSNDIIKESILRNNNFKTVINTIKKNGLKIIRYEYLNNKGKIINTIILTEKDLK